MTKAEKKKLMTEITNIFRAEYPDYFGAKAGANSLVAVCAGRVHSRQNNGCHNAIGGLLDHTTQAIFSTLWCRYDDLYEAAIDYWTYLLGPKGPWSKYMTDIEIIYDTKGRPKAFGTWNMKQKKNAWVPCMMQARVPQESSNKLRSYWHWRKSGLDQPTSLYLSEHLQLHITGYFSQVPVDYTQAFNWKDPGIDIERLRSCNPIIVNDKEINTSYSYGPVNKCWVTEGGIDPKCPWSFRTKKLPTAFRFEVIAGKMNYSGLLPSAFKAANDNSLEFKNTMFVSPKEAVIKLKEAYGWQ